MLLRLHKFLRSLGENPWKRHASDELAPELSRVRREILRKLAARMRRPSTLARG